MGFKQVRRSAMAVTFSLSFAAIATSQSAAALQVGGVFILPPAGEVAGRDTGELGAEWWRYFAEDLLGSPNLGNPYNPGPLETEGVSFLYGLPPGSTSGTLSAVVQPGQFVLWPLVPWTNIATDPLETEQDLLDQLAPLIAQTTSLQVIVNGVDFETDTGLDPLNVFRAPFPDEPGESGFNVILSDPNIFGLPPGPAGPLVSDGYWVVLGPLESGQHVFTVTATNEDGGGFTVTQEVTAVPLPLPAALLGIALFSLAASARTRARAV